MKVIILLVTFLPTLIESYFDRHGEKKAEKKKDTLWLVIAVAVSLGLVYWLFDINPVWPALLILMFRFTMFDYIVNAFLKRDSEGHKDINIWGYLGDTTHWWDQLTAKVPWKIRLIVRAVVFSASILLFFS